MMDLAGKKKEHGNLILADIFIRPWYTYIYKDPDAGKGWGHEEKGVTEGEMVGWYHQLNGHEFEQTSGDSERQKNLV